MKKAIMAVALAGAASICSAQTAKVDIKGGPMHPLCKNCHQADTNMIRGVLDNAIKKANTLQIDVGTHKEVLRFDDKTAVKNLAEDDELNDFRGKGFRVHYVERKGGEKYAILITRFDILKSIKPEDKLTRDGFKKFVADNANVQVFDSRPAGAYQEAHIPGAKVLPAPEFDKLHAQVLPQDKNIPLVFYCVGGCLSPTNTMHAKALGYTNVKVYTGGIVEWSQTDYTATTPGWLKNAIEKDMAYVLVDLRPHEQANAEHIKSAVSLPLASFDQAKAAFPKQKSAPIVLYGDGKEEAAKKLLSWGYNRVRVLPTGFDDWKKAGHPVAAGPAATTIAFVPKPKPGTVAVAEFKQIAAGQASDSVLIDVRNPDEAAKGKIKTALNIPLDELTHRLAELPKDKRVVLYCETGARSEIAHNALKNVGVASRYLDAPMKIAKDGTFTVDE